MPDTGEKITALLIEDNPDDALLMQAALDEAAGAAIVVEWVDRLALGLERLRSPGVDVVLLDLSLPDGQGVDTCVRVNASAPDVPIVVLTGLADLDTSVAALRVGAQDYLVKGDVNGDLLVRSLRYAIERKHAEVQLRDTLQEKQALLDEIQQLYAQERRSADQLRVIGEVGRQISSIMDVDELLQKIVDELQATFHYYHVGIGLVDGDALDYRVGAGELWRRTGVEFESARIKLGVEGITGWVAASGEPVLAHDVSLNEHYFKMPHSETRSELTVPIRAAGEIIGVLDVQSDRLDAFDESDLTVLQSLADQAGIAIRNARLFAESQEMAVLGERNRMAREMHDTLAQGFTGIVLQLEAAEQAYEEGDSEVALHLESAKALARYCLQEARRSVWNLLPQALEQHSLESALRTEVRRFGGEGREAASFASDGECAELPPHVQSALFRICQESLTNIRKHARARNVQVELACAPGLVSLSISDDGVGIDPASAERSRSEGGGFGLLGMEQRAVQLGGTFSIESQPGHGTVVRVEVPLEIRPGK